jgi:hypothetical protein
MEFILDQLTHVAVLQVKAAEQQAKVVEQQARTDKRLDRAIRRRWWKPAGSARSAVSWVTD